MDRLAEHEAFLRAIFDAPDDDTPRLVYADFLEENGEPVRAEFIRVQCRLAALPAGPESPEVHDLRQRERELLESLHPELGLIRWTPEEWARIKVDRGFVTQPTAIVCPGELDDVREFRGKVVRSRPHWFGVNSLAVQPGWFLQPEHIPILFELAALQRVTEWDLGGYVEEVAGGPQTEDGGAYALIDMNEQPAIRLEGVEALAQHRGAKRITALDLTYNRLENDAARALIRSRYLINLRRLDVGDNRFSGEMWAQLRERFGADVVG